jgi:hypothetical protein
MAHHVSPTAQKIALCLALIVLSSQPVAAAGYIRCNQNDSCTIGEFLYDDDYTPITTATCTLTTRDPGGSLILDSVALTGQSDGWYAYDVNTTGYSPGVYRTQLCCTHLSEQLCIDKSFTINLPELSAEDIGSAVWDATASNFTTPGSLGAVVQNPAINPEDIWNYSNRSLTDYGSLVTDIWSNPARTLTGFGTLVADIWSYTNRSLTTFGTLITSIWSNPTRTLTSIDLDSGSLATQTDILALNEALKKEVKDSAGDTRTHVTTQTSQVKSQISALHTDIATMSGNPAYSDALNRIYAQILDNREVLEALVNEPVVKTFIDDGSTTSPDLQAKITTTKATASGLFATTQQVISRLGVVNLKLAQFTPQTLIAELTELSLLVNDPQAPTDSITNQVAWLEKAWGYRVTGELSQASGELLSAIKLAQSHLLGASSVDGSRTALITAAEAARRLEKNIGDVSHTGNETTLYGYVAKVQLLATSLDENDQALTDLLSRWPKEPALNKERQISQLEKRVLNVNQITNAKSFLSTKGDTPDAVKKNHVLGLKAISTTNRLLLAKMAGEPISNIWLEEGSVIFRALVINPSERISQKVPLKYYLPKEIRTEDIITHDPDLTVKFDANENAVYVEGEFTLAPGESRTFMVEVNDIFLIPESTLASLRQQAGELLKPMERTAYFGQGATLKSDIDVIVGKIVERQNSAHTPESRIRTYRENQIEMAGAAQKLDQLKTLLTDSGSSASMFGFFGSVATIWMWAIALVIVSGVVFLSLYLKMLRRQAYAAAGYLAPEAYAPATLDAPSWPTELIKRYTDRLARVKAIPQIDAGTRFFQIIFIILTASALTVIIITTIFNPTSDSAAQSSSSTPIIFSSSR